MSVFVVWQSGCRLMPASERKARLLPKNPHNQLLLFQKREKA